MAEPVYVSKVKLEMLDPPGDRIAWLPGEDGPIAYGVHGAIAEHYGVDASKFDRHATTIDHVVGAAVG
jgi:hypothetical protein